MSPLWVDPVIREPLERAMRHEDPRWFTTGPLLVNHPADKGGLTRGGITARTWGAYKNLQRPATAAELAAIGRDEAFAFYYHEFVVKPRFTSIPDQQLRAMAIDWSFTSGPARVWRAIQRSLKARAIYTGPIDGIPGPVTRAALLQDSDPRTTHADVLRERALFYLTLALQDRPVDDLMRRDRTLQIHNLRGWLTRTLSYLL
jgi:lysozyme family protein